MAGRVNMSNLARGAGARRARLGILGPVRALDARGSAVRFAEDFLPTELR